MKTLREYIDLVDGKVDENWGSWRSKPKEPPKPPEIRPSFHPDFKQTEPEEPTVRKDVRPMSGAEYDEWYKKTYTDKGLKEQGAKQPLAQVGDTVVYHDFTGFKQKKSVVVSIHKRDWGYQYHLKNDDILDDLSFEEPGGAEVIRKDVAEDEATAKMGLMSAVGSNDNNPADQRRAMAQQAVEQLASKK